MTNIITHQGTVENIDGSRITVRIIQTSACAACSVKGHCSSADSKEKLVEITDSSSSYRVGDRVTIIGTTSMGMFAVLLAFVFPFCLLIFALFVFMAILQDELFAALLSLGLLIPYYCILWMNKARMKQKFSFTIKPINN